MRYIILVLLNLPIVFLALTNLLTKYKTKRISRQRFYRQSASWVILSIVLIGSFPVYNILTGAPALESASLSLFDIVEITAIVFLLYTVNALRQRVSASEHYAKQLHQQLSIQSSIEKNKQD